MDNRAIGIFDSGLGGLTTVRRLQQIMPQENIIYFGDTGRVPYGSRGRDTIIKYTRQDLHFLLGFDLKAVVIACNTASATALEIVRDEVQVPLFGTVLPSCHRAEQVTQNGKIGVIGTAATVRSDIYRRSLQAQNSALTVHSLACPLFVPLVENGRVKRGDRVIELVVSEYLQPLKDADIDTLILGCTHYPLLREVISDFMGDRVALIDSGAEAANAVKSTVQAAEGAGSARYFVSDDPESFAKLANLFLQRPVGAAATLVDITQY